MSQIVRSRLKLGVCLVLLACIGVQRTQAARRPGVKPNIVLLFIDDMGWMDTGYAGSDFYETPNIDQLAKDGMIFTDAYSGAGNCAPSRAVLMSGQYGPRHKTYAVGGTTRGPKEFQRLVAVPSEMGLRTEVITIAEALNDAGYTCGQFGKWHLLNKARLEEEIPTAQGFVCGTYLNMADPKSYTPEEGPKQIKKITEETCRFMEENKDRPFFAYVAHHANHTKFQSYPETLEYFKKKEPGQLHSDPELAAMNKDLDDGIGIVLQKVKDLGLEENTLVLFTSDNGGLPISSQKPLRAFKGAYYEGGIRVPMVAKWAGKIQSGTTCNVPVSNVDFFPTFLDLAQAKVPAGKILDGESLLPLFTQQRKELKRDAIFWYFPGYLNISNKGSRHPKFRTPPVAVIRKGDWKLHLFFEEWVLDGGWDKRETNNSIELYNLRSDIGETENLANKNPEMRDTLIKRLQQWIKDVEAPVPTEANPKYTGVKAKKGKSKKRKKKN